MVTKNTRPNEPFVPELPCPDNCEISFDPTVVPRLRLWINPNSNETRWVGAMYQDGSWFVNSIGPNNYVAATEGHNEDQYVAWNQMTEAARKEGWKV